jgi:hypothetical protein
MARKVAIIGKAASVAFAPWYDPEWEIWGMPWLLSPRVTRMFEVHEQAFVDACEGQDADASWLPKFLDRHGDVPVYCDPSRMHAFPNSVEYPLAEVMKFLPFPYLETTISYEIALALYEGVDEIGLFGIHMMGRAEFVWQRSSVIYLIGLAQGMGVKVTIPPGSPLFLSGYESGRYGKGTAKRDITIITGWNPHHQS